MITRLSSIRNLSLISFKITNMKYIVSYKKPNNHYIDIEFIIDKVDSDKIKVQLPAWRPGRYELGNFAKNVQKWEAFNYKGDRLSSKKITKDLWEVETNGTSEVHIKYNYFANEINAGSSYLDDKQLYINGVNCFLYLPNRQNEGCELELKIPSTYKVATGLTQTSKHNFKAKDFHELVDSPFIASNNLQHFSFDESNVKFHLWFNGECKPDWNKLETDFRKFIKNQIEAFGGFPVNEYHFLFQILTYRTYHGVEHSNSTVISLGPSYDIMRTEGWYNELLGVSSHELYHTWNVKQIRPTEMLPYDYSKENYTVMGYLDEGVTTYYGDKFLLTSGVFDWELYAKTFNQLLDRHFNNFGVNNYSVAQSSFDTWLDGYVKGAPGRKGSIYTEGALVAFMTDIFILKNTQNKKSLNTVMKTLFEDFAKKGLGVGDEDYKKVIEEVSGTSYEDIYNNYIHGNKDYTNLLKDALNYIGCELSVELSKKHNEAYLGFKVRYENGSCLIDNICHNSLAEQKGLAINDEIIAINGVKINNDLELWSNYFINEEIGLSIKRELSTITKISFIPNEKSVGFSDYKIIKLKENDNYTHWKTV
ncbi:M61 family metallopeptidase [Vicingus serpentipes]|uniref:M61 family metallopeptidase n=2 Tax=Vicingus serpentipes TaxID=1926625 RepID=A0A5C6RYN8_9FLAO|nr:M61 family metallopeptidase [Vicingus serpentipes]